MSTAKEVLHTYTHTYIYIYTKEFSCCNKNFFIVQKLNEVQ